MRRGRPEFVATLKAVGYTAPPSSRSTPRARRARPTWPYPEQVKSALENRGTWSTASVNVRFPRDGLLRGLAGEDYADEALLQIWADLSPSDLEQLRSRPANDACSYARPRPC